MMQFGLRRTRKYSGRRHRLVDHGEHYRQVQCRLKNEAYNSFRF
jgi:hypothetical protein